MTLQLAQAQAEAKTARNAEEANHLTVVALLTRNKELEEVREEAERKCQEQKERLEADAVEVGHIQCLEIIGRGRRCEYLSGFTSFLG